MKTSILVCFIAIVFVSVSCAGFDYTISNVYYGGTLTLDSESLLVTGAGAHEVAAFGSSYVEVRGTAPLQEFAGGIHTLDLKNNSRLAYYDGEMNGLWIYGNSQATFEGGSINSIRSFQNVFDVIVGWDDDGNPIYNTHIELISKDYAYNPATTTLTGTWADDSTFNIQLLNQSGWDTVFDNIKFTIIPEPTSILLLAGGMVLMRKRLWCTRSQ